MITRALIKDRIFQEAARQGLAPREFALKASLLVRDAEQVGETFSDEQVRELQMRATLENVLPGILNDIGKNEDRESIWMTFGLLLLVLFSLVIVHGDETEEDRQAYQEAALRDEAAISARLQHETDKRRDWQEFARQMAEGITAPPLSDYAVSRASIYEDDRD